MAIYEVSVKVFATDKVEIVTVSAEDEETAIEYVCQNEYTDGNEAMIVGVEQVQ